MLAGLLDELGKRIADRWFVLLVLPGALFVATAAVGWTLGDAHWSDAALVAVWAARLSRQVSGGGTAATVLVLAVTLLLSTAAGLLAQATGTVVVAVWSGEVPPWPGRLAAWLRSRRHARWRHANRRYVEAEWDVFSTPDDGPAADDAERRRRTWQARRNRIAYAEPARPAWIGDRLAAATRRVWAEYRLDLTAAWPRLWLIVPEPARTELREAIGRFDQAAIVAGWGLLYLVVGLRWWPAIVGGVVALVVGWRRGRAAAALLADLLESAVDIYGVQLARAVGVPCASDRLTPADGEDVTRLLRKGL